MKATYVRMSTFEQNISRQLKGKDGEVHWDKISGMVAFRKKDWLKKLGEKFWNILYTEFN